MKNNKILNTKNLVLLALLTAIVIVLQVLAAVLPVYPFKLALVLVPVVIGSALISPLAGAWLGLVFGGVVLYTSLTFSDPFVMILMSHNPFATVGIILIKGTLAGLAAGFIYRMIESKGRSIATITAAVICPAVNTGLFAAGMYIFFYPLLEQFTLDEYGTINAANIAALVFIGWIGINFIFELSVNLIFSPSIVRLINYGRENKISKAEAASDK